MSTIIPVDFIDSSKMAAALLMRHDVHFSDDTRRQDTPGSPHHDTRSIVLRGPAGGADPDNWFQDVEHVDYEVLAGWPSARQVIDLIRQSHLTRTGKPAHFGKIMVVGLKPNGWVDWHIDTGEYATAHDRFHMCLVPSPGAWLYSGGYTAILPPGQLTYVENHIPHSALNMGPVERVHLIVDIRRTEAVN